MDLMFKETLDRHLYTNDNSIHLNESKREEITEETMDPDDTLRYIIAKYKLNL